MRPTPGGLGDVADRRGVVPALLEEGEGGGPQPVADLARAGPAAGPAGGPVRAGTGPPRIGETRCREYGTEYRIERWSARDECRERRSGGLRPDGSRHRGGLREGRPRRGGGRVEPGGGRGRTGPARGLAAARGVARQARLRRGGPAAHPGRDRARRAGRPRPGRRGDRGGRGGQGRPLQAPRPGRHRSRRDPGEQHLVDPDHEARRRDLAAPAGAGHPLLQPGAGAQARRAGAEPADLGARRRRPRGPSSRTCSASARSSARTAPASSSTRCWCPSSSPASG